MQYEVVVFDFETYYAKDYSLSKMTTEEYVNDPRFEIIMLGIIWPDESREVVTGTMAEIEWHLSHYDWSQYAILAHHTHFDGLIAARKLNIRPAVWLCTLSMARAVFGNRGNSLAALAKHFDLPDKGTAVVNMMGRTRQSLSHDEFLFYADYCLHDAWLCLSIFRFLMDGWYTFSPYDRRDPFPMEELRLIDMHIRMYVEPRLVLNTDRLKSYLSDVQSRKQQLLDDCGHDKELLSSNQKFAELLRSYGVVPPTKISPTTGKEAYAFAKTDPGLKELLEHDDERVQTIVAARLGVKSTIEETRTERLIGIAERNEGLFPVPLKYYAAHTGRAGGMDSVNAQNFRSRGAEGGKLKSCIEAPPKYVIIDCDSSNIEARKLAWVAQQNDLVADFAAGIDVYCKMGGIIYGREITKKDVELRFTSKTVVLGAGFGTGAAKLQITLKAADPSVELPLDECQRIIHMYRRTYRMIVKLWEQADKALQAIHDDQCMWLGREGVLWVDGKRGIRLPNGLYIKYPQLHRSSPGEWQYKSDKGMTPIYGAKVVENCIQALARIIVMRQAQRVARRYPVVLLVHDSVVALARESEKTAARAYIEECMRWVPKWAQGCPITCESKMGTNYGFKDIAEGK